MTGKKLPVCLVLTGGKGRRIGKEKALLPWGDGTLVSHITQIVQATFQETYLVGFSHPPELAGLKEVKIINEPVRIGPLGALLAGLEATSAEGVFMVACDMPFIRAHAIRQICMAAAAADADVALPVSPDGRHPLFAFYRRTCLPHIRECLETGNRRVDYFFTKVRVAQVKTSGHQGYWQRILANLNTRADYLKAFSDSYPNRAPPFCENEHPEPHSLSRWKGTPHNPPVVCFVGKSGAGKTTLLEKLIPELKKSDIRVGTVKHHSHSGFEIDHEGKDTWRHAQAGSDHVVISSPDRIASIRKPQKEISLGEIVDGMTDVDLILVEGYKRSGFPKIEIIRSERANEPICGEDEVLALVTDLPSPYSVPTFGLDDSRQLAQFLISLMGR